MSTQSPLDPADQPATSEDSLPNIFLIAQKLIPSEKLRLVGVGFSSLMDKTTTGEVSPVALIATLMTGSSVAGHLVQSAQPRFTGDLFIVAVGVHTVFLISFNNTHFHYLSPKFFEDILMEATASQNIAAISPMDVEVNGEELVITKESAKKMRITVISSKTEVFEKMPTACQLADNIRPIIKYILPSHLIADVIEGRWKERMNDIEKACTDDQYVKCFFDIIRFLDKKNKRAFILAASTGPSCLTTLTETFLSDMTMVMTKTIKMKKDFKPTKIVFNLWIISTLLLILDILIRTGAIPYSLPAWIDGIIMVFGLFLGAPMNLFLAILVLVYISMWIEDVFEKRWYTFQLAEFRRLATLGKSSR